MLLTTFFIALAISTEARVVDVVKNDERALCTTQECKDFAAEIKANMKNSVNPCDDFYEYVCGNWAERNPLPPGKTITKVLMVITEQNKRKVENLLNADSQDDEIPSVKIVKKWFKACTNTESIEKRGLEPLIPLLSRGGGWPMLMAPGTWNENTYTWQSVDDYYTQLRALNSLHEIRVAAYGTNATELSAVLDMPSLPPASWLLDAEVEEHNQSSSEESSASDENSEEMLKVTKKMNKDGVYWKFIANVMRAMAEATGSNIRKEDLDRDIEDLLNFQWKLSKLTYTIDEYVNMTISDFQKWYDGLEPRTDTSKVNWTRKIVNLFKDAKTNVDVNTNLKVTSLNYFKKLILLLDQTPNRTIVNYLHWNFVSNVISRTTNEMKKLVETTKAGGDEQDEDETPRPEKCIEESKMNDIISYEYIRKFFSDKTVEKALAVIQDIEKEIEVQIQGSNWADKTIKEFALRKLRTIKKNVAYPDWYNNATIMNNYFDGLAMGSTYFENALNLDKYYTLRDLRTLKQDNNIKPWIVDPLTINAFYLTADNSITVPAANLQKPFFSLAQPDTINYALTGYLLAHEMNHGFDYQRHIYDENGEEIQWSNEMKKEYNEMVKCFVDQFDNYTLDGKSGGPKIKDYGNQTLEENMSDTMGLQAVFRAYQQKERINGKLEAVLPGLESFNNDQIFFLSFGNLWCENIHPDFLNILPKLDMHSTGRIRVTGTLSNNEDFAKTFNCPVGSPMNPKKKCNIWNKYNTNNSWWKWSKSYETCQI